jgi:hypothetical protein
MRRNRERIAVGSGGEPMLAFYPGSRFAPNDFVLQNRANLAVRRLTAIGRIGNGRANRPS